MPTSLVSTGVQFPDSTVQTTAAVSPTLYTDYPAYKVATTYPWQLTAFDSYTTYTISTSNGTVSRTVDIIYYTPASLGAGGFTVNGRVITLTIDTPYFISVFYSSTGSMSGTGGGADSIGNVYTTATAVTPGSSLQGTFIAKYTLGGTVQWERIIRPITNGYPSIYSTTDSLGNIYGVGTATFFSGPEITYFKTNKYGEIQYQRTIGFSATNEDGNFIYADTNNVCVAGSAYSGSIYWAYVAKISPTDGTVIARRMIGNGTSSENLYSNSVTVDSSSNVILLTYSNSSTYPLIFKFDSNLNIQWQIQVTLAGAFFRSVATLTDGSVIVVGSYTNIIHTARITSGGAFSWGARYFTGGFTGNARSVAVDSSDNVYVLANMSNFIIILKYNSTGTLLFERRLVNSESSIFATRISVDSAAGLMYINCTWQANSSLPTYNSLLTICLPTDGTKTGTYQVFGTSSTFTYSNPNYTNQSFSFSVSSISYTIGSGFTPSYAATTVPIQNTSLYSSKVAIP